MQAESLGHWDDRFEDVLISGSGADAERAYVHFAGAMSNPRPLVVSLHTWSGDYTQKDPLAPMVADAGWNYIRPNFRGPNWTPEACLSEAALADIDEAIRYSLRSGNVDEAHIYVIGVSGGGYAAIGHAISSKLKVSRVFSWVPISDLSAWFHQTRRSGRDYADHILKCVGGSDVPNSAEARRRSPLFMPIENRDFASIEIYAGIDDGYTGSVPISHSIEFFDRIAKEFGYATVDPESYVKLLDRSAVPVQNLFIADRSVFLRQENPRISLVVFEGGHEILAEYAFSRIRLAVGEDRQNPDERQ